MIGERSRAQPQRKQCDMRIGGRGGTGARLDQHLRAGRRAGPLCGGGAREQRPQIGRGGSKTPGETQIHGAAFAPERLKVA